MRHRPQEVSGSQEIVWRLQGQGMISAGRWTFIDEPLRAVDVLQSIYTSGS